MMNKEDIDNLLRQIQSLETLVLELDGKEAVPSTFFVQSLELTGQISRALYNVERVRVNQLERQLKEQHNYIGEIKERLKEEEARVRVLEEMNNAVKEVEPVIVPVQAPVEVVAPFPQAKQDTIQPQKTAPKAAEKTGLSLKEILEKKSLSDFRKSFSLNDRFFFKKELFGGDESKMSKVIDDLNQVSSLDDAMSYLRSELNWDFDNAVVADFVSRLEKRFL